MMEFGGFLVVKLYLKKGGSAGFLYQNYTFWW
jgi:hypothetical protein